MHHCLCFRLLERFVLYIYLYSYNIFIHSFYRQPVQNIPLKLLQPKEIHEGIWGGEAIIKGFYKRKP